MSNPQSPQSVSNLKQLGVVSPLAQRSRQTSQPGGLQHAPNLTDAVEISPNGKEIGGLPRVDFEKMSPQELLQFAHNLFQKFDLDQDGKVSAREANKLGIPKETFDRYDENGDGSVELRGEFAPAFLRDLSQSGQISQAQRLGALKELGGMGLVMKEFLQTFHRFDLDGNGKVSMREAAKMGVDEETFKSWDANGDGQVGLFDEYLPKIVESLREQGVIDRGEYDQLMTRIQNAAEGDREPERQRRPERAEDPIRVREHTERWLRGHSLDRRALEDFARRILES